MSWNYRDKFAQEPAEDIETTTDAPSPAPEVELEVELEEASE